MPRKSTRQSASSATRASSKRRLSAAITPTKQQRKRAKKVASTPTKSQYFEKEESEESEDSVSEEESKEASDFGSAEVSATENDDEDEDEYESEDDAPRSAKRGPPKKSAGKESQIVFKPGSKLPPGTRLVIQKPKARQAGSTPYRDERIHPNTMLFLKDLLKNNDRNWLKSNDPDFRQSEEDWKSFVECLTQRLVQADETIPELPVKDVVFRIYRDVRFSKDQTPYKPYFSAAWSRTGRKGPYAAYYVQLQPDGKSFVGGGLWRPEASSLAMMRRDIDRKPHRIKGVLTNLDLRKAFLTSSGAGKDEKAALKAFVEKNAENALKTKPKGFDNDHENIELLRLRDYTIGRRLTDDEMVGAKGLDNISRLLTALVPFITYLNSVVRPDEPASSSSSNEGESGSEEEDE